MRISSGIAVTGIVAVALATVGVLTAQASDAPLRPYLAGVTGRGLTDPSVKQAKGALPLGSGSGERVVYSVSGQRVWLVGARGRVLRSYRVTAGDVPPSLGTHRVFDRHSHGLGGDGAAVVDAVLFASHGSDNVGFSAAARPTARTPDPHRLAGAIRERRADAEALWKRATIGAIVEVVG